MRERVRRTFLERDKKQNIFRTYKKSLSGPASKNQMQTQCVRCLLAASSSSSSQRGASTFPVAAGRRRRRSLYLRRVAAEMEKVDNADNDDVNNNNNVSSIQLIRTINNASKQNSDDESSEQLEDKIFALMDALEREQEDVEKDLGLVGGTFSLLFTGGATDASEKERKQKEGKIGSFVTKVTGSSSSARKKKTKSSSSSSSNSKNFQIIDLENERVENRADLLVFNRVPISVRIFGSCVRTTGDDGSNNSASSSAAASLAPSATRPRFSVCFTHAKIEVFGKERVRVPLERFNARGWIDVTYVDDLIRLGVGDKGSRFVTARLKKSEQRNNPE